MGSYHTKVDINPLVDQFAGPFDRIGVESILRRVIKWQEEKLKLDIQIWWTY